MPPAQANALVDSARGFGIPGLALVDGVCAPGGLAVDEHTWFSVASLGKHVTAAAVLALSQRGRLDLSEPIGRYLLDVPSSWATRTVLSLLRHSGGLAEYLSATPQDGVPSTRSGFMARYAALAPAFAEGAGWMYTNTHYILLGMLVAQAGGAHYAEVIDALMQDAGCDGAAVAGPEWARLANSDAARAKTSDPDSATREVIGDGDICFTAAGALRWLEVLLCGDILDRQHDALMFTPGTLATGRPSGYGCGWFVEPLGEATMAHHGGHFDGWTAMGIVNRARGSAVLAMCNQAPGHTRAIRYLAQAALEGFAPGSTPLALPVIADEDTSTTDRIRTQLLRTPGTAPDLSCLAEELQRVAEHGSPVRTVPNLFAGDPPLGFDLVERLAHSTHTWHRYRLTYPDRIEHVLVGTTPAGRIHWAWPL